MKRYWIRTTHKFNEATQEWEFKKELPLSSPVSQSLGVHGLDSEKWLSEEEILAENRRYFEQEQEDCPTDELIIQELEELEKIGLAKSGARLSNRRKAEQNEHRID